MLFAGVGLSAVNLTISSGSGAPGGTVVLDIPISTTGTQAASVQWTVNYSATDISSISVAAGAAATAAEKLVSCNMATPGVLNCLAFGVNTLGIGNGVLARVTATISPSTVATSTVVGLTSVVAASGDNPPVSLSATPAAPNVVNGTVSITQPTLTSVTVTTSPSGLQITVDGTAYTAPRTFQWAAGTSHTIATTSPQGSGSTRYVYANWSDGGAQSHTVTAPASAATYTAGFTTQYQLTTSANPVGSGTVSPASGTFYNSGATVQLTATPNSGQQFTGWSGDATGTSNPTTITMSAPRNVVANFTAASQNITVTTNPPGLQITVDGTSYTSPQTFQWTPGTSHTIATTSPQGSGTTRYVYASWSDGGAQSHTVTAPASAATYTASFTTQYQLTTSVTPAGTGSVSPASGTFYNSGATVQLTATPNSGQQFTGWSGDATGTSNPTTITMSAPRNVVANFTAASQNITVTTNPPGLQVTVDGTSYTSPQTFQWTPGTSHTIATSSPQGSGSTRYVYASWSDGGGQSHTVTAPASAATYTASFTTQYQLTTSVTPAGTGTVSPASGTFYNSGATVQLTATPNSGQQFTGWSGDATGTSNPTTITMSAPRNVVANFTAASQNITVTTNPPGLQVTVDGTSYTSPQTFQWTPGTSHTIATSSPQGSGSTRYVYASWSDGGGQSHTVTAPASAATYTASFTTQYQLTTSVTPAGTGTVSPASGTFYNSGASVQISATANSGQQFTGWSGDATGTSNPTTITMSAPRNVVANFTAASQNITVTTNPPGLQVTVDGTSYTSPQTFQWTPGTSHTIATTSPQGSGTTRYVYASWSDGGAQSHTVTAPSTPTTYAASFTTQYQLTTSVTPAGTGSVSPASGTFYNSGASVQLSATANSGQQFTGWSGDATGTSNPTTITMSAPRNVVANFTAASQNITVTTNPAGLQITVDGTSYTSPQTFQWTPGTSHTIATTSPQGSGTTRYVYASWSDGGTQSHTVTAPSTPTTYAASFTTQYQLTTSVTPAGTGSVSPASGTFYNSGASVQLSATANSGQQFTGWSGDATGTSSPTTITMSAPRNVVANFTAASQNITVTTNPPGLQITVDGTSYTSPQTFQWTPGTSHTIATTSPQGSGTTRYVYASWSDGGAQSHTVTAPSTPTTYAASFTTQYQLTTSVTPAGTGSVSPASGTFYNSGASVQLSATANSGQQFTGWSGDATGTSNPTTITMSAPRNVVANFTAASQNITVTTNPAGLQITVDGTSYTSPQTFQWTPGTSHTIATTSPQGSGTTRYVYASWSDGGAQSHTVTAPSTPTTYAASFTTQYQLTTSVTPAGTGSVSPASGTFYNSGASVQLSATANSGQQFTGWSGDATGTSNPTTITMSAPRNVVASFSTAQQSFTVTTSIPGLQITVDGTAYTSPQTFQWTPGTSHTISTTSPQGSGGTRYVFTNWSDGGAQSHSITAPASATTYTATFKTQYQLTLTANPSTGGNVTPASGTYYDAGTSVQISATANSGQQFTGWSGDATGTTNPLILAMNAARSVAANFTAASQGITITTVPSGLQIVVDGNTYTAPQTFQWTSGSSHTIGTLSPQGSGSTRHVYANWSDGGAQSHSITTPSAATTYTVSFKTQYQLTTSANPSGSGTVSPASGTFYDSGATVSISATANSGQQFTGWGGDASGTTNPVTVTMSSARNVVANFSAASQGVTVTSVPSGLQIVVDGTTYTAPRTFQWTPGSSHTIATSSPQGSGGTRHVFANWSDGGAMSHSITTPASATTYTASFTTQYRLTTSASPNGHGSVTPSSGGYYDAGSVVQVSATPNSGRQFQSWGGDASGTANPVSVTMSAARNVVANFGNGSSTSGITITTQPSGLRVMIDGTLYTTPQTFNWAQGTAHTLDAPSPQFSGSTRYVFQGWSDGGSQSHNITVNSSISTYTASFKVRNKLTTTASPAAGGTVEVSPTSADGYYDAGTQIFLTANPSPGFQFRGWTGGATGSSRTLSLVLNEQTVINAEFGGFSDECSIDLNRSSFAAASEGDFHRVNVRTGDSCSWTAISAVPWITINTGASGVGRGAVGFSVMGNFTSAARTGTIAINGKTVTVTQSNADCGSNIVIRNAVQPPLSATGATVTLNVSAPNGCQWTASTPSTWLTILSGSSGTGAGVVIVGASANPNLLPRIGSVQVGGAATPLLQRGVVGQQYYRDVNSSNIFEPNILMMVLNNILAGCSDTDFCPDMNATRSDLAPMVVRSLLGDNFTYTQSPYFVDVPPTHPNFRFIQKMRDLNITIGCTATMFCPNDTLTRGQMAAFLIRAKLGGSGVPVIGGNVNQTVFPSNAFFDDVPPTHPFFPFVQKIKQLGITNGCALTQFCPDEMTSRGEASAFVTRAFLAQ